MADDPDRERVVELLDLAAGFLRAEADATIEATVGQAQEWPSAAIEALLRALARAVVAEDHIDRHMGEPATAMDMMMGRLIAKHTPMMGNGDPLDLADVARMVALTAAGLEALSADEDAQRP
jgi:hypothetical protein